GVPDRGGGGAAGAAGGVTHSGRTPTVREGVDFQTHPLPHGRGSPERALHELLTAPGCPWPIRWEDAELRGPGMTEQPSEAVQDYLKAIHRLGGGDHLVSPNDIATALAVKPPSVTGMLTRLAD